MIHRNSVKRRVTDNIEKECEKIKYNLDVKNLVI